MPVLGTFPSPPDGNDDFLPGSVISSSENDGNFSTITSYLNSQFVDDSLIILGAINGDKIADNSLVQVKLSRKLDVGLAAVGTTEIQPFAVTNAELALDAVQTGNILDGTILDADVSTPANPLDIVNGISGLKIQGDSIPATALDSSIQFPVAVTGELANFAFDGDQTVLLKSEIEPVNISVYPVGTPGLPYTRSVGDNPAGPGDWYFIEGNGAPDQIGHVTAANGGTIPFGASPLGDVEVDYIAAAGAPPLNSVGSPQIVNGSILDSDINAAAGIALSKLAVDPLARGNHTGTQIAATISNFVATTQSIGVGGDMTGTVGNIQLAGNVVGSAEIGVLPAGAYHRTGTGTPGTANSWQNILYPAVLSPLQAGMVAYNDGTNIAGFTVPITGWYLITVQGEFTSASAAASNALGVRIVQGPGTGGGTLLGKDVQGWNGSSLDPGAGLSIARKLNAGDIVRGQFIGSANGLLPDTDSSMSIVWISD